MAYEVKFDTGQIIEFKNKPTQQDIEEAFLILNPKPKIPQGFEGSRTPEADMRSAESTGAVFPRITGQDKFLPNLGKAIGNLPGSALNLGKNLGSALLNVLNPNLEKNTVANLAKLGVGTAQKLIPGQQKQ